MRDPRQRVLGGLSGSLLLMLTSAAPAFAQPDADRATARALGLEGSQALDGHDYATAEDRFRRADRLVHAPTLMLGLARALAGERKLVEATEAYSRILREGVGAGAPEPFKRALRDASKELDEVLPKLGSVTILVNAQGGGDVANASALLDGVPLNSASLGVRRVVDPGPHTLKVTGEGFQAAEVRFVIPEGGSLNEPVTLQRERSRAPEPSRANNASAGGRPALGGTPPDAPAGARSSASASETARSPLPWVAFGVGGAGLIAGAVAGMVAAGQHSGLANACTPKCLPDRRKDLDAYHTVATIADVGFAVAGAGMAAGIVLLLTQPTPHAEGNQGGANGASGGTGLRLTPVLGPGSVGAVVQF